MDIDSDGNKKAPNRRQIQCPYWLIKILFSDEFADDFGSLGNATDQQELDSGKAPNNQQFWEQVQVAFCDKGSFGSLYFSDDKMFVDCGIDPSIIVSHDWKKLRTIWKSINSDYKEVYCKFTQSGNNHAEENFVKYCKKLKSMCILLASIYFGTPSAAQGAGLPKNVGVSSDMPIPSIPTPSVVSGDTPMNRKRMEKGYKTLAMAVTAIADPAYKQERLEMMACEDACKEKAELRCDAKEVHEQERLSMEQQSNNGLGEYERLCALIRKNRTDLKDQSLDADEREDLLRSNRLLIKRREKLEAKLF